MNGFLLGIMVGAALMGIMCHAEIVKKDEELERIKSLMRVLGRDDHWWKKNLRRMEVRELNEVE